MFTIPLSREMPLLPLLTAGAATVSEWAFSITVCIGYMSAVLCERVCVCVCV